MILLKRGINYRNALGSQSYRERRRSIMDCGPRASSFSYLGACGHDRGVDGGVSPRGSSMGAERRCEAGAAPTLSYRFRRGVDASFGLGSF